MSRMRAGVLAPECCPQLRRTFGARSPCTSPGKRHANKLAALPVDHISGAFQLEQFRRARAGDARQPHCTYDVVGLGQAMCDFSGKVAQEYLGSRQLQLGGRRVIDVEERATLFEELKVAGFELNAAGSLANTLAACALLSSARDEAEVGRGLQRPRVAMAGPIGDDHLGQFFQAHFAKTGVDWIEDPQTNTGTGTCIVLTTPDAQRSFLSYPGPPRPLQLSEATYSAIASSRCLVVEGYLWELPNAAQAITRAIRVAKDAGRVVALTVADVSVVRRFRTEMLEALRSADIIFTNADEARELIGDGLALSAHAPGHERSGSVHSAQDAAMQLGRLCPVAVVTDGSHGSCITALGHPYVVPPHWAREPPVDTCGAGDAYAAGFLHGYLSGMPVRAMGDFAAATASAVISHQGPQLLPDHARQLAACRPVVSDVDSGLDEGALFGANHVWTCQPVL